MGIHGIRSCYQSNSNTAHKRHLRRFAENMRRKNRRGRILAAPLSYRSTICENGLTSRLRSTIGHEECSTDLPDEGGFHFYGLTLGEQWEWRNLLTMLGNGGVARSE